MSIFSQLWVPSTWCSIPGEVCLVTQLSPFPVNRQFSPVPSCCCRLPFWIEAAVEAFEVWVSGVGKEQFHSLVLLLTLPFLHFWCPWSFGEYSIRARGKPAGPVIMTKSLWTTPSSDLSSFHLFLQIFSLGPEFRMEFWAADLMLFT